MNTVKKNNIAFTFATAEVSRIGQIFIMIMELLTGKIRLKKLYDDYLSENRPPQLFWDDAVSKLNLTLKTSFQEGSYIPKKGKLIVIANHAVGVADGEWKQWVSKLILKTKSPVLPIFFDGQNSQWYHVANKLGLTFRYSLCMYELKRKIGDNIYMYFGSIISYDHLAKIGDIREITSYLRSVTYSLGPPINNNYIFIIYENSI